ncbi:hypothetical protein Leryth_011619 [Lithospermum erythrorhizon]|nr:hypothetical protein Leryth_011619 [Lithospermum erythrorhizon]
MDDFDDDALGVMQTNISRLVNPQMKKHKTHGWHQAIFPMSNTPPHPPKERSLNRTNGEMVFSSLLSC